MTRADAMNGLTFSLNLRPCNCDAVSRRRNRLTRRFYSTYSSLVANLMANCEPD